VPGTRRFIATDFSHNQEPHLDISFNIFAPKEEESDDKPTSTIPSRNSIVEPYSFEKSASLSTPNSLLTTAINSRKFRGRKVSDFGRGQILKFGIDNELDEKVISEMQLSVEEIKNTEDTPILSQVVDNNNLDSDNLQVTNVLNNLVSPGPSNFSTPVVPDRVKGRRASEYSKKTIQTKEFLESDDISAPLKLKLPKIAIQAFDNEEVQKN
jgi:hypothetical protein